MQRRLKIGVLYSRVRVEEKWIFAALEKRGIDYDRLDDRAIHFDLNDSTPWRLMERPSPTPLRSALRSTSATPRRRSILSAAI